MISKMKMGDRDFVQLLPQFSLIWCLLNITENTLENLPIKIVATILLLFSDLAYLPKYWLIFIISYLLYFIPNLVTADNHRWLFLYFIFGIYISLLQKDPKKQLSHEAIKRTSISLIIVSFSLAFLWKLLTPKYMDTSFFEFVLAGGDHRLQDFVVLILGYLPQDIKHNIYLIENFIPGNPIQAYATPLIISGPLKAASAFFTYYALAIELAVPTLYLISLKNKAYRKYASYSLLVFIISVYFITPVYGFGEILALLGLASCEDKRMEKNFFWSFIFMMALYAQWSYKLI